MINSKVTNIKNIRLNYIPYIVSFIIFYGWVLSFFSWWVNDYSHSFIFSDSQLFIIDFAILLFVALFVFVIKPKNFNKYIKYGGIFAICILVIYGMYVYIPSLSIIKYVLYLLPISIGFIYAGFLSLYIYILNNSEKFYAIVLANLVVSVYAFLHYICNINIFNSYIIFVVLLVISIMLSFRYESDDYNREEDKLAKTAPKIKCVLYLSLVIDCVFLVFIRGVGRAILLISDISLNYSLEPFYYVGAFVGSILVFLLYSFVKKCNSITWNIVFGFFVFSVFLYFTSMNSFVMKIYAFILGACMTMGMCSMYYILGVISKKYWNYDYVKYNVVIIDIIGCCFGALLGNYMYVLNDIWITNIIVIISVLIVVILLILSPLLIITFFNDKWDEDSTRGLIDNLNVRKFMKYNLTNKEILVCNYLLDNLTVRQIAINMNISENTVKFHKKQIFEKLGISSKDEIFKLIK